LFYRVGKLGLKRSNNQQWFWENILRTKNMLHFS